MPPDCLMCVRHSCHGAPALVPLTGWFCPKSNPMIFIVGFVNLSSPVSSLLLSLSASLLSLSWLLLLLLLLLLLSSAVLLLCVLDLVLFLSLFLTCLR